MLSYGLFIGRFKYQVTYHHLLLKNYPKSFNGLKIIQISDIHLGTYLNHEKDLERVMKIINESKPDLVFFTGDLINSFAEEVPIFLPILKKIKAKTGKFAVFGNHDYSDYYIWENDNERIENHKKLINYFSDIGFKILFNERLSIIRGTDTLYLAGIENWGLQPYRQEGDIDQTLKGSKAKDFIILLSHDPMFWDKFVHNYANIRITFSGHTHGMQIGINLGQKHWSPFKDGYNKWVGMYNFKSQILYVNRGLGGGTYPGRIGMLPEISVFELSNEN